MKAKPLKNASSVLLFSGHSELETGLLENARVLSEALGVGKGVTFFVMQTLKMTRQEG